MFQVSKDKIDSDLLRRKVDRGEAGAIVLFEGIVRNHTGDKKVAYLEYEAYEEMALKKLEEVAVEVVASRDIWVAISHRFGRLEIGDIAVTIAVSSPHRADAFDACSRIIDRLKEEVPIWKKEVGEDGSEWVGWGP